MKAGSGPSAVYQADLDPNELAWALGGFPLGPGPLGGVRDPRRPSEGSRRIRLSLLEPGRGRGRGGGGRGGGGLAGGRPPSRDLPRQSSPGPFPAPQRLWTIAGSGSCDDQALSAARARPRGSLDGQRGSGAGRPRPRAAGGRERGRRRSWRAAGPGTWD